MTSVRSKRGKRRVVSATVPASRGRRRGTLAATPPARLPVATTPAELAMVLAVALGQLATAEAREQRSPSADATEERRRAQRHVRDVRHRLRAKVGRDVERQLVAGLVVDGGLALRAAVAADEALRPYAIRSLLDATRTAGEHGIESPAAWVMLARSARWSALAAWALDAAFADAGPGRGELAKLAAQAGQQARLDMVGALHIAESVRRRVPAFPTIDLAARIREHEAEQAAAYPAEPDEPGRPDEPDDSDDAPDSDDGIGPSAGDHAPDAQRPVRAADASSGLPVRPGSPTVGRPTVRPPPNANGQGRRFEPSPNFYSRPVPPPPLKGPDDV